jgi:hypothetical protein
VLHWHNFGWPHTFVQKANLLVVDILVVDPLRDTRLSHTNGSVKDIFDSDTRVDKHSAVFSPGIEDQSGSWYGCFSLWKKQPLQVSVSCSSPFSNAK